MKIDPRKILESAYLQENLGPSNTILAEHFSHQKEVILFAWKRMVTEKSRGIILADEVGLGKTFEALWSIYFNSIVSNTQSNKISNKILIVVPPKLVTKWIEELEKFSDHIERIEKTLPPAVVAISNSFRNAAYRANILEVRKGSDGLQVGRGKIDKKGIGIFILKDSKLARVTLGPNSDYRRARQQFASINWNIVCFDEAHRYARGTDGEGNNRSAAAKSLCGKLERTGSKIILCTATPFQLDTHELEGLIGLINSSESIRQKLVNAIDTYNESVNKLREHISQNKTIDDTAIPIENIVGAKEELEKVLRPWIVRSRRPEQEGRERRTHTLSDVEPGIAFPWLYWKVRDWICESAREGISRTFVPTTLHMTLSSPSALKQHISTWAKKTGRRKKSNSGIVEHVSSVLTI